ncbi:MAG: class I SAM-dependent methyltransferase [Candidatus Bathyarchaeota archaeon]|nr:class I SAM-dependent methyltransferase [Candidatus Bathyarchaeota archaeon]
MSSNKIIKQTSIIRKLIPFTSYLRKNRSLVVSRYSSGVVLDVGCGPAEILHYFPKENHVRYVGVDTNKPEIEGLGKKYPSLEFYWVDVDKQDLPPQVSALRFDTVLLIAVIEHLKCPEVLLGQLSKLIKHNGKLIMTTATPMGEHVHNMLAIFGLTSFEAIQEHKTAAHASYSTQQLLELVAPFGFELSKQHKFEFGLNQVIIFTKIR